MTKEEAKQALKEGKKVAHRHFTSKEWVKKLGGLYEFEDTCVCRPQEFWRGRSSGSWLDGWRIVS